MSARKRKQPAVAVSPPPASYNPLRDKPLLEATAHAHAKSLPCGHQLTAMQFCMQVLDELGLHGYAIGQAERIWISSARKAALQHNDAAMIIKPPAAGSVDIPSIEEMTSALLLEPAVPQSSVEDDLRRRLESQLDPAALRHGMVHLGGFLSGEEVSMIAQSLPAAISSSSTCLRESSGSGRCGAYQALSVRAAPGLAALSRALAAVLREKLGCDGLGDKVLATRYGVGGCNFAHQDQSTWPYQGYLLLSRPGVDFTGGEVYLTDPAGKHAAHAAHAAKAGATPAAGDEPQAEWRTSGDLVLFAANAMAGGGRSWYHGVREVRAGPEGTCQMLAIGLLE